jgi:hypothetical protein
VSALTCTVTAAPWLMSAAGLTPTWTHGDRTTLPVALHVEQQPQVSATMAKSAVFCRPSIGILP